MILTELATFYTTSPMTFPYAYEFVIFIKLPMLERWKIYSIVTICFSFLIFLTCFVHRDMIISHDPKNQVSFGYFFIINFTVSHFDLFTCFF
ncbi:MAG: hypothetical protein EBS49_05725 [Verrucomicrobia bacterium]|nr:hypothetical protein [Verrucomicrobiota bacterium]